MPCHTCSHTQPSVSHYAMTLSQWAQDCCSVLHRGEAARVCTPLGWQSSTKRLMCCRQAMTQCIHACMACIALNGRAPHSSPVTAAGSVLSWPTLLSLLLLLDLRKQYCFPSSTLVWSALTLQAPHCRDFPPVEQQELCQTASGPFGHGDLVTAVSHPLRHTYKATFQPPSLKNTHSPKHSISAAHALQHKPLVPHTQSSFPTSTCSPPP
jgi:hypothetical protein